MTNEQAISIMKIQRPRKGTKEKLEAYDMAIKTLEQTRWIPCSERLPESDDEVLVTDDACGLALVGIDWFDNDSNRWCCSQNVTAWMPLLEPYRGIKHTCSECIIKDTDACSRGNTEADEVACEDFMGGDKE